MASAESEFEQLTFDYSGLVAVASDLLKPEAQLIDWEILEWLTAAFDD